MPAESYLEMRAKAQLAAEHEEGDTFQLRAFASVLLEAVDQLAAKVDELFLELDLLRNDCARGA